MHDKILQPIKRIHYSWEDYYFGGSLPIIVLIIFPCHPRPREAHTSRSSLHVAKRMPVLPKRSEINGQQNVFSHKCKFEFLVLVGFVDIRKIGSIFMNYRQSMTQSTNGSHGFQMQIHPVVYMWVISAGRLRAWITRWQTSQAEPGSRQVHRSFINKDEDMQIAGVISTCTNKTTTLNSAWD